MVRLTTYVAVECFKLLGYIEGGTDVHLQPVTVDPTLQTRSSSEEFLQQSIRQGAPLTVYQMTQALQVVFNKD
jgi:hypothetical protein